MKEGFRVWGPGGAQMTEGPIGIGTTSLTAGAALTVSGTSTFSGNMNVGGTDLTRRFMVTGGTVTTAVSPVYITQTVNAAAVAFPGIKAVFTEGASGTAAGTNLLDLWYGTSGAEASKFSIDKYGSAFFNAGITLSGTSGLNFNSRTKLLSASDGIGTFQAQAGTGFTTLNLGPTTGNTANGTLSIKKAYLGINIATDTGCAGKGTATITTTTGIPAGSLVLGVDANVTTTIAGSDGIASWALGHAGDTDAWGAALALAATTTTGIANFTVTTPGYFTGATNLTLTGTGGKKIDSGVLKITIYYIALTAAAAG